MSAEKLGKEWLEFSRYNPKWRARSRVAASMFRHKWVCDIGSGREHVSAYLPLDSVYLPADLRQWHGGVEFCDLNAGHFPTKHLTKCDIVVILGVEQVLRDIGNVLRHLSVYAEYILISQHPKELNPNRSAPHAITSEEFVSLLNDAGFAIIKTREFRGRYYARNVKFTHRQSQAREAARLSHPPQLMKHRVWRVAQRIVPFLQGRMFVRGPSSP